MNGHSHILIPLVIIRSPLFGNLWRSVTNLFEWNLNWSIANTGIARDKLVSELCTQRDSSARLYSHQRRSMQRVMHSVCRSWNQSDRLALHARAKPCDVYRISDLRWESIVSCTSESTSSRVRVCVLTDTRFGDCIPGWLRRLLRIHTYRGGDK